MRRNVAAAYVLALALVGVALWIELWLVRTAGLEFRFLSGWLGVALLLYVSHRRMQHERAARADATRAAAQSDRVAQLAIALGRARAPVAVIEAAVQESLDAMRADAGMLLLVSKDRTSASIARTVAYESEAVEQQEGISLLVRSPLGDAVQRGAPVILESPAAWRAEYADGPDHARLTNFDATVVVPVKGSHGVVAILRLDFRAARTFTSEDYQFLSGLGPAAAQALDRAWQYESAQRARVQSEALRERANQELVERQKTEQALRASETRYRALATRTAAMHQLTAALSEAVTVNAVATAVVHHGGVLVGATAGAVSLLVQDGAQFETLHVEASDHAPCAPQAVAAEAGLCATAAVQTAQPVFVASWAESQEQYWRSASCAADLAHLSSATLPLLVEGRPIGVLEFHFSVPVNFDDEYKALLVSVAQHCTQAMDRARLYESAQRARTEAETANRLKDDFLSIVSHELRTPLNAVVGWASMLRQRSVNAEVTPRAVQSIYDNALRQAKLIDDLLDVSRMATGQATLDLQEVDLATLMAGVVESVIPAAASDEVEVIVRSMPSVTISGDRRRLEQVFFNLLGNALKFTPPGGRVTIDATCRDQAVELRVSDNGMGIEPEFLPYVFDRFRQGDSSPTRSHGGLGLGLSIAKQLVEAHGGRIAVESAGRNLGTTFSVTFPLIQRSADVASPTDRVVVRPSAAVAPPRLNGISVLVVDDEPDAREVMAHALRASGARVTLATSAEEAFNALVSTPVDVLLADIAMPEADGYALIRRIRASLDARVATVPAAAVTAHASQVEQEEAFGAGFQCHLAKPVEPSDLVRAVGQLAHGSAARV